jgi:hypothetical protein
MSDPSFIWNVNTLSSAYVSNDLTNWVLLSINPGRNYITDQSKFRQFTYMMLPPNSVAYLYNNIVASSDEYQSKFVGSYFAKANGGNYTTKPFALSGIQVIDFHSDPNYITYCLPDSTTTDCTDSEPAVLPPPTYFQPPSTTWIWVSLAVLAFCCLVVFVLIILFIVGVFKFGQHSVNKSASLVDDDEKASSSKSSKSDI